MKNKYFAIWLSLICIILFIFQIIISGFTDALILNENSFFEIWRFVAAIFLHGSFSHLIFNIFALILFGTILENLIGSKRFLFVFFLSGILANLVSVFFYSSSLGASGAIFGILGTLAIIKPKMIVWVFNLPMPMFVAAIIWILVAVYGIFNPSNVGDIAHLSGILIGIFIGFFLRKKHFQKNLLKANYSRVNISEKEIRDWEDRFMR